MLSINFTPQIWNYMLGRNYRLRVNVGDPWSSFSVYILYYTLYFQSNNCNATTACFSDTKCHGHSRSCSTNLYIVCNTHTSANMGWSNGIWSSWHLLTIILIVLIVCIICDTYKTITGYFQSDRLRVFFSSSNISTDINILFMYLLVNNLIIITIK